VIVAGGANVVENRRFENPEKIWHRFRFPTRSCAVQHSILATSRKKRRRKKVFRESLEENEPWRREFQTGGFNPFSFRR